MPRFFQIAMIRILRLVAVSVLWPLYFIVGMFPRNQKIAVFGSANGQYFGNTKYAFQNAKFHHEVRKIWITQTVDQYRKLKPLLLNRVYYRWSLKGIYYAASAATHYVNCYPGDINVWLSRKAIVINFWHGIPLKKIENHIQNGPMALYFNPIGLRQKALRQLALIVNFGAFRKSDFVYCHSKIWVDLIADAFGIPSSRVIPEPSPVLQHLVHQSSANRRDVYGSTKKILYLPTMREAYPAGWIAAGPLGKLEELDRFCGEHATELHIKLHPNEACAHVNGRNLQFMPADWDIYTHMYNYDLVITDYSSIAFELDFASIPYALYWFDLEIYRQESRDLYFDIEHIFEGTKLYGLDDIQGLISGKIPEYFIKLNYDSLNKQIHLALDGLVIGASPGL